MRYTRGLAFITTALLLMPLTTLADGPDATRLSSTGESADSMRPASVKPVTLADTALGDAREILSEDNTCSSFFGGASEVVAVLDELAGRIQVGKLPDRFVGIRMSGGETTFISHLTGYEYRLFKKVIINTSGPFYSSGNVFSPMPRCGSFWPNTREARVLMLLHELGHMIKGANGKWLLPDDGVSDQLSKNNTRTVESRCMAQIRALQDRDRLARKSEDDAGDKR
jgi:hypothetical protein